MLANTLGILIGFVTILLLFSLLVTTLSQAIQSALSLRARGLRRGVAWLLRETFAQDATAERVVKSAEQVAASVVTSDVTWLEKDELLSDLGDRGVPVPASLKERFDLQFAVMSRYLTDWFTRRMQYISFGLALGLAFAFQLSAPELLKRLSTEPELRAKLDATALALTASELPPAQSQTAYQQVNERTLARFVEKYPETKAALEEISGEAANRTRLEREVRAILVDRKVPRAERLAEEYVDLADELHLENVNAKLNEAANRGQQLALYDIVLWPKGWGFYAKVDTCLGVLISAILISLGAPFWFNTLKNLINLRDMIKPADKK